ncbi:MAG: DNA repair protein RadC [Bacteroidota bacterium]
MEYTLDQPITHWALEDRPREKLLQRGLGALTDAELLAIIIGSGSRELSALGLAQHILNQTGGLADLARAQVTELTHIKGIGPAKAISIVATFELGRRKSLPQNKKFRVSGSSSAAQYLSPILQDQNQEVFYVLFLNRNHEIESEKEIFRGGIASTIVDPKLVFREAIHRLASSIIVAHNHPSGNLKPSQADIQITQKLQKGSQLFDITLLDHLIISQKGYFSFADEGLM